MISNLRWALRVSLTVLFWCLMAYWAIFVGYAVEKFVAGGARSVLGWYAHMSDPGLSSARWRFDTFMLRQGSLLVLTVAVWFFRAKGTAKGTAKGPG